MNYLNTLGNVTRQINREINLNQARIEPKWACIYAAYIHGHVKCLVNKLSPRTSNACFFIERLTKSLVNEVIIF